MGSNGKRKEILADFLREVWSEGNIAAADQYLAASYTIHHDPGDPWEKRALDREGFKERVRLSRAPFPDQKFAVQEMFEDRNAVIVTWLWTGTHKGEVAGFPASGKPIHTSGTTVYYFNGSRIAGHWQVTDRLAIFQQLQENPPRE